MQIRQTETTNHSSRQIHHNLRDMQPLAKFSFYLVEIPGLCGGGAREVMLCYIIWWLMAFRLFAASKMTFFLKR